jgi:hypothetical protein
MLQSTAAHLSSFLAQPPERIELGQLADSVERFKGYLQDRRFKRNSIRTYMYYTRLLIRKARLLGWETTSPGLEDEWKRILPIAKRYKCATVIRYAIRKGLTPAQFSESHLKDMAETMIQEGRSFQQAIAVQWRFRKCVRESGLQVDLPGVAPPRRKTLVVAHPEVNKFEQRPVFS